MLNDNDKRSSRAHRKGAAPGTIRLAMYLMLAGAGISMTACAPVVSVYAQPSRVVWGDEAYRSQNLDIPPGHLPPPGMCRIWFPGRPPGQQPPPGDCDELQYEVPPGAALVYG